MIKFLYACSTVAAFGFLLLFTIFVFKYEYWNNEMDMRLANIQSTLVHESPESSSSSSSSSEDISTTEQFCQDCSDYYATHKAARDEFTQCDNHVYYSTVMATVCQFHMGDQICPPFKNPYCNGPMYPPFQKLHHE